MSFDEDPDDERPFPDRLLPPEDRLWRHPSEIGASDRIASPPVPNGRADRRSPAVTALAGACLVGAVVAFGAMWIARPTRVVEKELPTASIRNTTLVAGAAQSFASGALPTQDLARRLSPAITRLRIERDGAWTTATALWIDDRGTAVTAAALVAGATTVLLTGNDGLERTAAIAGTDDRSGIAALVVDRTTGRPATRSTAEPRTGQPAALVGAAGADAGSSDAEATLAAVVVRSPGLRATVSSTVGNIVIHDAIQLDRAVPDDALGGAVVDAQGRLLGMAVGNSVERDLGTVVPARTLLSAGTDLRDRGEVRRAVLGVRAVDLDPDEAEHSGVDHGARLTEVTANSPAERAGLRVGDVVTSIADVDVDDASDVVNVLAGQEPGTQIDVTYQRDGTGDTLTVTLGG